MAVDFCPVSTIYTQNTRSKHTQYMPKNCPRNKSWSGKCDRVNPPTKCCKGPGNKLYPEIRDECEKGDTAVLWSHF